MGLQRILILPGLLGGLAACSPSAPSAAPTAGSGAGADLFNGNCVACHQQNAQGLPGVFPSLVGSPVLLGDPAALALWVVKGQRPASMPQGRYPSAMPQFGWMKASDAAALFTFLRANFGNHAPPVEASAIAAAIGD